MTELQHFGDNVWTMSGDTVRMVAIPFATRMTIIRLANGNLWVHSPVAPTEERIAAVHSLGPVVHIVAPNKIHSLGFAQWKEQFPSAIGWVSPQFRDRHPDIPADKILGDEPDSEWPSEIGYHIFRGSVFLDEVLFLHKESSTLIVTDLIQRHDPLEQNWFWRVIKKWAGVLGSGGTARDLRATFRDRESARRSRDQILSWEFDNLIVCHGACINGGAHEYVRNALAWLD